jgi:hypothetical protein
MEQGADWIPVKIRAWVYRGLTTVLGLNAVFHWFDDGVVGKIVSAAAVLGFGLASVYTPTKKD